MAVLTDLSRVSGEQAAGGWRSAPCWRASLAEPGGGGAVVELFHAVVLCCHAEDGAVGKGRAATAGWPHFRTLRAEDVCGKRVIVIGGGADALDAACAVALLNEGQRVRLVASASSPAAAALCGGSLLDGARHRALRAALQPHYTLPRPGLVDRALRAPTKRRFWAVVKGRAASLLARKSGVTSASPEPWRVPGAAATAGDVSEPRATTAGANKPGDGDGEDSAVVVWAPSPADPRVMPFLDGELREALMEAGEEAADDVSSGGGGFPHQRAWSSALVLYRGMVHPAAPGLVLLGLQSHATSDPRVDELQVRWALAHLLGALPLPPAAAISSDLSRQRSWRRAALASPLMSTHGSLARAHERHYAAQLEADLAAALAGPPDPDLDPADGAAVTAAPSVASSHERNGALPSPGWQQVSSTATADAADRAVDGSAPLSAGAGASRMGACDEGAHADQVDEAAPTATAPAVVVVVDGALEQGGGGAAPDAGGGCGSAQAVEGLDQSGQGQNRSSIRTRSTGGEAGSIRGLASGHPAQPQVLPLGQRQHEEEEECLAVEEPATCPSPAEAAPPQAPTHTDACISAAAAAVATTGPAASVQLHYEPCAPYTVPMRGDSSPSTTRGSRDGRGPASPCALKAISTGALPISAPKAQQPPGPETAAPLPPPPPVSASSPLPPAILRPAAADWPSLTRPQQASRSMDLQPGTDAVPGATAGALPAQPESEPANARGSPHMPPAAAAAAAMGGLSPLGVHGAATGSSASAALPLTMPMQVGVRRVLRRNTTSRLRPREAGGGGGGGGGGGAIHGAITQAAPAAEEPLSSSWRARIEYSGAPAWPRSSKEINGLSGRGSGTLGPRASAGDASAGALGAVAAAAAAAPYHVEPRTSGPGGAHRQPGGASPAAAFDARADDGRSSALGMMASQLAALRAHLHSPDSNPFPDVVRTSGGRGAAAASVVAPAAPSAPPVDVVTWNSPHGPAAASVGLRPPGHPLAIAVRGGDEGGGGAGGGGLRGLARGSGGASPRRLSRMARSLVERRSADMQPSPSGERHSPGSGKRLARVALRGDIAAAAAAPLLPYGGGGDGGGSGGDAGSFLLGHDGGAAGSPLSQRGGGGERATPPSRRLTRDLSGASRSTTATGLAAATDGSGNNTGAHSGSAPFVARLARGLRGALAFGSGAAGAGGAAGGDTHSSGGSASPMTLAGADGGDTGYFALHQSASPAAARVEAVGLGAVAVGGAGSLPPGSPFSTSSRFEGGDRHSPVSMRVPLRSLGRLLMESGGAGSGGEADGSGGLSSGAAAAGGGGGPDGGASSQRSSAQRRRGALLMDWARPHRHSCNGTDGPAGGSGGGGGILRGATWSRSRRFGSGRMAADSSRTSLLNQAADAATVPYRVKVGASGGGAATDAASAATGVPSLAGAAGLSPPRPYRHDAPAGLGGGGLADGSCYGLDAEASQEAGHSLRGGAGGAGASAAAGATADSSVRGRLLLLAAREPLPSKCIYSSAGCADSAADDDSMPLRTFTHGSRQSRQSAVRTLHELDTLEEMAMPYERPYMMYGMYDTEPSLRDHGAGFPAAHAGDRRGAAGAAAARRSTGGLPPVPPPLTLECLAEAEAAARAEMLQGSPGPCSPASLEKRISEAKQERIVGTVSAWLREMFRSNSAAEGREGGPTSSGGPGFVSGTSVVAAAAAGCSRYGEEEAGSGGEVVPVVAARASRGRLPAHSTSEASLMSGC
ncbi:hypothetical protein GPECTOR_156g86 [Gonium pectorale]|uniref:FAD/NAD(P)-binding domain-containing protein n=1 Tax=Gonium pectorale TaxID=33097 RepID=A0A150FXM2_GONPE|nr:hypothetical protein GPECTOR_156g86 [Gonium pectorale]|eukprot:KXZ42362.1 hypothetical protein GPECTOR_156g86 [Gonium pectorale]